MIRKYYELITTLAMFNIKIRYKGSILGFGWSMLKPLLLMATIYIVINFIFGFNLEAPYLFLGLILWNFFSGGTLQCLSSIVAKAHIIKKVYFPREIIVLSYALSSLISMFFEYGVYILFIIFFGNHLTLNILAVIPIIFIEFILVYGVGLLLSPLYIYYRDLSEIWDVILLIIFYLTPIFWPEGFVTGKMEMIMLLNPLYQIITMARGIVLHGIYPSYLDWAILIGYCCLFYIIGKSFFDRKKSTFGRVL